MMCPICKTRLKSKTIWTNVCKNGCHYTESSAKYREVSGGQKIQELTLIISKNLQYNIFVIHFSKNKYKTLISIQSANKIGRSKSSSLVKLKSFEIELDDKKLDLSMGTQKLINKINGYMVYKQ